MKRTAVRATMASAAVLDPPPPARVMALQPYRAGMLPLAFTTALAALSAIPLVAEHQRVLWSFWGAAGASGAWVAGLLARARARGGALAMESAVRRQHYHQACGRGS